MESLITLTKNLIRIPSVTANQVALNNCAGIIVDYFRGTSLTVERAVSNGIPSVIVTKNSKHPTVFLCGHFDVVDADAVQFEPREKNGKLFGRGALDMKSGVAVLMYLMKELADTDHSVGLVLTGDEEIGGMNGTKYVLDTLGYRCDVAILPDGGFAPASIVAKQKGVCFLTVSANGVAAHGSRPWAGDNAIETLMKALDAIRSLYPQVTIDNEYWGNTVTISTISGGSAMNMVPPVASATCDIRFIEGYTPEKIIADIQEIIPPNTTVEEKAVGPMVDLDLQHPLVQPFISCATGLGFSPTMVTAHGSSDARFFVPYHTPVIMSQPFGGNHHGNDEWVDIKSIEQYYVLLKQYVDRVSRTPIVSTATHSNAV